jgi:hypothetical protein
MASARIARPAAPLRTIPPSTNSAVDADVVREQCERILSNPLFCNSRRYSGLLKYIVEQTLEGHHDCLKERIIGIEVFGRAPDYDTSLDSTVRVALAEVRKRLSRYFEEPGHEEELRIELPAGSYIAEFSSPHEQSSKQQTVSARRKLFYSLAGIALGVAILAFAGWGVQLVLNPTTAIDRFWAPMLNYSHPILICIGSPSTATPDPVPPGGASVPGAPEMPLSKFITQQVNFPLADLNAANSISAFLARHSREASIRLADSTTLSELHGAPVVVLGSFLNEWAIRLGGDLHFRFHRDSPQGLNWIEDSSNPSQRNWSVDRRLSYDQVTSEYALITRDFDRTTGQWWIGVAGITVLGTLAGEQMVMDPKAMSALSAQLPKDWDRKNLQVVLEIKMVKGSPGATRVISTYCW